MSMRKMLESSVLQQVSTLQHTISVVAPVIPAMYYISNRDFARLSSTVSIDCNTKQYTCSVVVLYDENGPYSLGLESRY